MNRTEQEIALHQVEAYCEALDRLGMLNGSVLIGHRGKAILNKGYGYANFEFDIPNTPKTKFRIGSITKQFTGMAVALLKEEGLLCADDAVSAHDPDYPNGERITIRHLLTHTSGIPNLTALPDYWNRVRLSTTLEESIARFKDLPLEFEPGEKHAYSNSGYILLSAIVERLSGLPFGTFLDERILKPLGMADSGHDDNRIVLKNRAAGYEIWGDVVHAEYIDMSIPSGAGAMYATTEDLFRWDQALHAGKPAGRTAYERMTTPVNGYGYGLAVYKQEIGGTTRRIIGHGGGINGFLSEYRRYMDEELTIIVLANLSATNAGAVADNLGRILLGETVPLPEERQAIRYDLGALALAGDYVLAVEPEELRVTISAEAGRLFASVGRWFKLEVVPFLADGDTVSCFIRRMAGTLTFAVMPDGVELTAELFGNTHRGRRSQ